MRQKLHVEWSADLHCLGYPCCNAFDLARGLEIGALRGKHQRRVTRMNARVLDMLDYRPGNDLPACSHCVHINLLSVLKELRNHDRMRHDTSAAFFRNTSHSRA